MPVMFSKNVRPVCLPYGKTLYSGRTATVIGWGSLRESKHRKNTYSSLKKLSIQVGTMYLRVICTKSEN